MRLEWIVPAVRFDNVSFSNERVSETLSKLKRLRAWQHRQTRSGRENHDWHDAELLYLQGVVLERARHSVKAREVWERLAAMFEKHFRPSEYWRLPTCRRCASRALGFAPNWFTVACELGAAPGKTSDVVNVLSEIARRSE